LFAAKVGIKVEEVINEFEDLKMRGAYKEKEILDSTLRICDVE